MRTISALSTAGFPDTLVGWRKTAIRYAGTIFSFSSSISASNGPTVTFFTLKCFFFLTNIIIDIIIKIATAKK